MDGTGIDKRISRTEKAFKESLIALCAKKDYSSISISDLTEQSGYSRSAFYARYGSKDILAERILEDEAKIYVKLSIDSFKNGRICTATILNLFKNVYDNQALYRLMFDETRRCAQLSSDRFLAKVYQKVMEGKPVKAIDQGVNESLFNYVSVSKYLAYMKFWVLNDFNYSAEYMAKQNELIETNDFFKLFAANTDGK